MNIKHFALIMTATVAVSGLAFAQRSSSTTGEDVEGPTSTVTINGVPITAPGVPAPSNAAPGNGLSAGNVSVAVSTNAAGIAATNAADASANTATGADFDTSGITPTNSLRMNFHDVPLTAVLNYLSAKTGYVVVSDIDLHGKVTIVSEQPVNTNEVFSLLSDALAKNGYSLTRNGRVLTVTTTDAARNAAQTPVITASSPDMIPATDQIATYILPVHTLDPVQLVKDLEQLVPQGATLTANAGGNALIMTGRQKDIHRFSEIINDLDSSSVSDVAVFVLKYADAKSVASELKEVFQSPDSSVSRADARQQFRGRGGFGGGFGMGGGGGADDANAKNAANKAVFTSDDQMNAVVVSVPPDYMPEVTNVINSLDKPSDEITEIRVFHLKYADPVEMADLIGNLFPDDTKTDQNSRTMATRFTLPWMQPQSSASSASDRMKREARVITAPDPRTDSIVVTTSKDLMTEIAGMITELDSSKQGIQHVYSFDIDSADPASVQATMAALYPSSKTVNSSTSADALATRAQTAANQQTTSSTSFGGAGNGTSASH